MVLRLSPSVQLYHGNTSCTTLQSRIKWYFPLFAPQDMNTLTHFITRFRGRSGITVTTRTNIVMGYVVL